MLRFGGRIIFFRALRGDYAPPAGCCAAWLLRCLLFSQNHAALPARPRSARTLRGFVRLRRASEGTLGAPPLKPRQEPEVPAPPTSSQFHATPPARPRFARTLHASSCACGARGAGTLGAPPLKPRQEPEVPAPPTSYSKPCKKTAPLPGRRFLFPIYFTVLAFLNGNATHLTCPLICSLEIGPIIWLSFDEERLSPRTKYSSSLSVYACML